MSIQKLADATAQEILTSIDGGGEQLDQISRIVEKTMLKVMRDSHSSCVEAVHQCCSADQDLAHKISDEIRQQELALIANLNSLR